MEPCLSRRRGKALQKCLRMSGLQNLAPWTRSRRRQSLEPMTAGSAAGDMTRNQSQAVVLRERKRVVG